MTARSEVKKAKWVRSQNGAWFLRVCGLELEICAAHRAGYHLYRRPFAEGWRFVAEHPTLTAAKQAGEQLAREHFKALMDSVPETKSKTKGKGK